MIRRAWIPLIVMILFAPAIMAQMQGQGEGKGPWWRYVEAGYVDFDADATPESRGGWFFGGTFGGEFFHVAAQYESVSTLVDDTTSWFVAGGFNGLLGEKADLVFDVGYTEFYAPLLSDSGFRVTGGARWQVIKLLELNAFVNWFEFYEVGNETTYELNAVATVGVVGFGLGYELGDNANRATAYIRFGAP